jgi:hypothetical protein
MQRTVDHELIQWKEDNSRKILLVRGARQVGKTYSVRKLGKTFNSYLEVNFEEHPQIMPFFDNSLNPYEICEKLSIYFGMDIIPISPSHLPIFHLLKVPAAGLSSYQLLAH